MTTPIKFPLILAACLVLSACGGGRDASQVGVTRAYATGPVQSACLRSDRRAASSSLCGCVQAAANGVLSRRDQSRAVRFFKDPHQAQVTRQSDRRSDEAFWQRYKTFVEQAERLCA